MKQTLCSAGDTYRRFRATKAKSRTYRIYRALSYSIATIVLAYFAIICFPQFLFAHDIQYKNFHVYSREPLDENIYRILDAAEVRLSRSTIYDPAISRRVFLTGSHSMYDFLSHKAYRSFANSVPGIENIFINRTDTAVDLVYVNRPERSNRSLSGVIAHEVTHFFIRRKIGFARLFLLPAWKNEGYCDYIAVDTSQTYEEGVRLWKENPDDDSKYKLFKYHMMVKYLLDTEKLTIDEVFDRDFDEGQLAVKVFNSF